MFNIMLPSTRRAIRAWATIGRGFGLPLSRWFGNAHGIGWGNLQNAATIDNSETVILVTPVARRGNFRRMRQLLNALRGVRKNVIIANQRQLKEAGFLSTKVIHQVPGYKEIPMTLIVNTHRKWSNIRQLWEYSPGNDYYLTGYDPNEGRKGYFLCQLPASETPYTSVSQAFAALEPESVTSATDLGRKVRRQGDLFAIEMENINPEDDPHFEQWGAERYGWLLGTNHTATEVIRIGDQTYARGKIIHNPDGRAPDHKPVRLGKKWHLVVKNNVPVEKRR